MDSCPSQHILAWLQRMMTTPINGITLCTLLDNYPDKVKAHILLKCFDNGLLQQPISSYIRLTVGVWNTFQHSCNEPIWRLMEGPGSQTRRALLSGPPLQGLRNHRVAFPVQSPLCMHHGVHYFCSHKSPEHCTDSSCLRGIPADEHLRQNASCGIRVPPLGFLLFARALHRYHSQALHHQAI